MSINLASGKFNIGRDITVVVKTQFGTLTIPNLMGFDAKQMTAEISVDRLDGTQLFAALPKGWNITIECERGSADVDNYFAQLEAAWYAGTSYEGAQVYTTITEPDGSTTAWLFDNVAFTLGEAGNWKGDASVKQTISGKANRRLAV